MAWNRTVTMSFPEPILTQILDGMYSIMPKWRTWFQNVWYSHNLQRMWMAISLLFTASTSLQIVNFLHITLYCVWCMDSTADIICTHAHRLVWKSEMVWKLYLFRWNQCVTIMDWHVWWYMCDRLQTIFKLFSVNSNGSPERCFQYHPSTTRVKMILWYYDEHVVQINCIDMHYVSVRMKLNIRLSYFN